jgi:hypothetical protein
MASHLAMNMGFFGYSNLRLADISLTVRGRCPVFCPEKTSFRTCPHGQVVGNAEYPAGLRTTLRTCPNALMPEFFRTCPQPLSMARQQETAAADSA